MASIREAAAYLESRTSVRPEIALVLGSGLGVLADSIQDAVTIDYADIPHFPVSTVEGHAGELLIGKLAGKPVLLMKGRFHMYEGYGAETVSFPVRVMKALGVKTLLVTNAAGGINASFKPGDLMLISDHINWMFRNPLIGPNDPEVGVRFPDMSEAYSKRLRALARRVGESVGVTFQEGVYAGLLGPTYETPAEIRMLRTLGADAVGMSTVPETIAARHSGIEVLGISCISNMAAGMLDQPLSHQEVMETAELVRETFIRVVTGIVAELPGSGD
ncbi:purine-nucleoside phosphorylase [Paenibacillus antri]|uniref:Purine nucleoside phosphorylase n=2 Tax=Paenibacillus antri TaxID=2582848 RepID=A0A5R9GBZ2_9BACL|nr:purine-nucleoside phosphorylase [Paenibacillus antri]